MSESLRSSLKLITENNPNEVKIVCDTLLRILRSIHEKPNDVALRKVRLESDDVLYNLMPYEGALEALFVIGFEEVIEIISLRRWLINPAFHILILRGV